MFFAKAPSRIETVNDLDGNVVNYFRVIRDKHEELMEALKLTPYARDEYYAAFEVSEIDSDVERARKFAVRCWQGIGSSNRYRNGFRSSQQSKSPHTTKEWRDVPERLTWASERLKNAQIENLPAIELLKRYNTPDVFIYADPPYLHGTRKNNLYKYEMKYADHVELLNALMDHPGKVLLSGYNNDLYDDMLVGWRKEQTFSQADGGVKRIETLWMNYTDNQMSIADIPGIIP